MSRLIASDNALRALLVLSQRAEGLRTSDVADALDISYTGAQKALAILEGDGIARLEERRFRFAPSSRADAAVRFALAFLPLDASLTALARGNDAVEFAGCDQRGAFVVFHRFSEPGAEARIRAAADILALANPDGPIEFIRKEDLRAALLDDIAPRRRAAGMRILAGSIERTFPDRTHHGEADARALGRLNEAIVAPSARRLQALARRFGLRRIVAFGSATRTDFRPDSDVDLLVEPVTGNHLGLDERVALMAEAERIFGRDVDVVAAPVRRSSLVDAIHRDGVVLFDAAR